MTTNITCIYMDDYKQNLYMECRSTCSVIIRAKLALLFALA